MRKLLATFAHNTDTGETVVAELLIREKAARENSVPPKENATRAALAR